MKSDVVSLPYTTLTVPNGCLFSAIFFSLFLPHIQNKKKLDNLFTQVFVNTDITQEILEKFLQNYLADNYLVMPENKQVFEKIIQTFQTYLFSHISSQKPEDALVIDTARTLFNRDINLIQTNKHYHCGIPQINIKSFFETLKKTKNFIGLEIKRERLLAILQTFLSIQTSINNKKEISTDIVQTIYAILDNLYLTLFVHNKRVFNTFFEEQSLQKAYKQYGEETLHALLFQDYCLYLLDDMLENKKLSNQTFPQSRIFVEDLIRTLYPEARQLRKLDQEIKIFIKSVKNQDILGHFQSLSTKIQALIKHAADHMISASTLQKICTDNIELILFMRLQHNIQQIHTKISFICTSIFDLLDTGLILEKFYLQFTQHHKILSTKNDKIIKLISTQNTNPCDSIEKLAETNHHTQKLFRVLEMIREAFLHLHQQIIASTDNTKTLDLSVKHIQEVFSVELAEIEIYEKKLAELYKKFLAYKNLQQTINKHFETVQKILSNTLEGKIAQYLEFPQKKRDAFYNETLRIISDLDAQNNLYLEINTAIEQASIYDKSGEKKLLIDWGKILQNNSQECFEKIAQILKDAIQLLPSQPFQSEQNFVQELKKGLLTLAKTVGKKLELLEKQDQDPSNSSVQTFN